MQFREMFCSLRPPLMYSHLCVCGVYARVKGWEYKEHQRRHLWEIHGVKSAPV